MSDVILNTGEPAQGIFATYAPAYIGSIWHIIPVGRKRNLRAKIPGIYSPHAYYYERASNTSCQIRKWCQKFPHHNIGICLRYNQLVLDSENDYGLSILADNAHMSVEELLMSTRSIQTGGGGNHLFFLTDGRTIYKNNYIKYEGEKLPIDVKKWGSFVMAAHSISHRGPYTIINDVPPALLPKSLHNFLARAGKVKFGPGAEPNYYRPKVQHIAWHNEPGYDDTEILDDENPPVNPPAPASPAPVNPPISWPNSWPDFDDKLETALKRWPIDINRGLNRDTQIADAARSLTRRYRRSHGRDFILAILHKLVIMQLHKCHATTTKQEAYRHAEHHLEQAWVAKDEQGELMFDGWNQQDYLQEWIDYNIPAHAITTQNTIQNVGIQSGIGITQQTTQNTIQNVGIQSGIGAMLKIAYHELFVAGKPDINFTIKQYGAVFGCTRTATIKDNMRRYITIPGWRTATKYELLIEIKAGHHGAGGVGIPGKYKIGHDYHQFVQLPPGV